MRLRLKRTQAAAVIALLLLTAATVQSAACGGKNVNTIVADTAGYGTTLMKGVKAMAEAVAAAEKTGGLQRNDAIKSMERLSVVTAKGEEAARYLDLLLAAQGTPAEKELAGKISAALDLIDSELFKALVPIKDEALRGQISAFAVEVSHTILIIVRDVIGRIK